MPKQSYHIMTYLILGLLAHACYAISVVGGVYIYLIIDLLIGSDTNNSGTATGGKEAPIIS